MGRVLAHGSHVPVQRLGADAGIRGRRVVASFDEDATTMAVAAARAALALAGPEASAAVPAAYLVTATPPYLDKTNASALHAALRLPASAFAGDVVGSPRSVFAALRAALATGGLVAAGDVRVGRPGSGDERTGADYGAALLLAPPGATVTADEVVADVLALGATTEELLDRWRLPSAPTAEVWEERFGFERYAALVRATAAEALRQAGIAAADHVVVTSPNAAVTKRARALLEGARPTPLGHAGATDPLLAVAAALDVATPGETVLVVSAADGCDAVVLRAGPALARRRPSAVAAQAEGGTEVRHTTYLAWRGLLERELPRRPEPDRPAAPASARAVAWKFGFVGAACTVCGFVHLPPVRVCRSCGATDAMAPVDAADLRGTVATSTVDRLAYSPSPPVVDVVVDLDGGGRCTLEVADADPATVGVGSRVDLVFRRLSTAGGVHNYFWKARVLPAAPTEEDA
ncbi:hydroxymethylglutaryl-CoA synthase [Nocardioides zeae]|uniref:Hydroxymethylglutaryl-CoA synthase n=1 Tax=Nocardioides zeae TaxID=1457234 RepID=A0A6P0HJ06_9ACTN|nr:hydroxymethylglutaryl-CoA synthase [Nocardioides zeae]